MAEMLRFGGGGAPYPRCPRKAEWLAIYRGDAPWLAAPGRQGSGLAAAACAEAAKLVTAGMEADVSGDAGAAADFMRGSFRDMRGRAELGLALGGFVLKPYPLPGGRAGAAFLLPQEYSILEAGPDGLPSRAVFFDAEPAAGLVRAETHEWHAATADYAITNEVHKSDGGLPEGAPLGAGALRKAARWAGLSERQEPRGAPGPLFGLFRPAVSCGRAPKGPEGVSFFDRAIPLLRLADLHLSGMEREFRMKEARICVDSLALDATRARGRRLPCLEEDLYVTLESDGSAKETFFQVFSPEIRTRDYLSAYNKYQQLVEDALGLMHGTFSAPDVTDRTATAVRESKHRTQATVAANRGALKEALAGALAATAFWRGARPDGMRLSLSFDDSFVRDRREELADMLEDVSMGLVRPEAYLSRKYGVTEAEALAMMPEGPQLLRDDRTALTWNRAELTGDAAADGGGE